MPPEDEPPAIPDPADDTKPPTGGKPDEAKSFTQDQVNALLADQKRKVESRYGDHAELKRKAAEHDAALEAAKSDHEKALDAARKEGAAQASQAGNARLVAAEARALAAAGKWRVSAAAVVRQLDLTAVKVSDDGSVDTTAIEAALADLAKAEPGLVADDKQKPPPSFGGGARTPSGPERPASLEDAVLARMKQS